MKEIQQIVAAFDEANRSGKQCALATVIHVEGSSYRRPGARMLVTEDGEFTGAVSGGCLEKDAMQKALLVMREQKARVVTYDTDDEDDTKLGFQLGCRGIIHILFEPINTNSGNVIQLLKTILQNRQPAVLLTLCSLKNKIAAIPGTILLQLKDGNVINFTSDNFITPEIAADISSVFLFQHSIFKEYELVNNSMTAFIEFIQPVTSLVIAGAGNDVIPLVQMAAITGWEITMIDGRSVYANKARFPQAKKIVVAKPGDALDQLTIDEQTVFLLMTHNYNYDIELLEQLLHKPVKYIGVLGPAKKLHQMLEELKQKGIDVDRHVSKIYGPAGLDMGAETSEEIALSILSEIKTVLMDMPANFLRDKQGPIHTE